MQPNFRAMARKLIENELREDVPGLARAVELEAILAHWMVELYDDAFEEGYACGTNQGSH